MNILMGIGNAMKGDDGVGIYVAKNFKENGWMPLDCGTAPENFTSIIKREKPERLVIVDAVEMGLRPGEFRTVPKEILASMSIGTHNLPLSHLMSYFEGHATRVTLLGIQPKSTEFSTGISKEVRAGAERIISILKEDEFDKLESLEPSLDNQVL